MGRYIGIPRQEAQRQSMFYTAVYPILPATWSFVAGRVPPVRPRGEAPDGIIEDVPAVPEVEANVPESDAL